MEQSGIEQALKQEGLTIKDDKEDILSGDFGTKDGPGGQDEWDILARITGTKAEAVREEIEAWQAVYEEELENIAAGIINIDLIVPSNPWQIRTIAIKITIIKSLMINKKTNMKIPAKVKVNK